MTWWVRARVNVRDRSGRRLDMVRLGEELWIYGRRMGLCLFALIFDRRSQIACALRQCRVKSSRTTTLALFGSSFSQLEAHALAERWDTVEVKRSASNPMSWWIQYVETAPSQYTTYTTSFNHGPTRSSSVARHTRRRTEQEE